ncbi:MAG: DUF2339 domain-containing protein [Candidatus Eisenbacteria bacterium]|nr:DUF2339 domain-containing protein [Candidatus Eisenbacteria bacterium]
MTFVALGLLVLAALIVPWWALATALGQRRRIRHLEERLARLEREAAGRGAALVAVPAPDAPAPAPPPQPIPFERPAAAAPAPATTPPGAPAPATRAATTATPAGRSIEQVIGGLWLQNVGAVLLLLGVFFLILWGYTSGRFGPGVLVVAGVALGLALGWRGDRLTKSVPAFGHALIGVGLGVVYLAFYLGHFTLHALDLRAAFALLALVSLGTVATGLFYRSQTVAALGVLGAFAPQLLATWLPMQGFSLAPLQMLAYLAAVNAAVFALAAREAWGTLDLATLLLTTSTWLLSYHDLRWGWGVQAGLCALYAGLGLAALPRLAAEPGRVRAVHVAVVTLAPLAFLAAAWPFIVYVTPAAGGALLAAMALAWLLAAVWVEPRRADEQLWRPLIGAAVVFLTAALQRAVGTESTPMVWCVEGFALVWIGLRWRGWLRACGYGVAFLGALRVFVMLATDTGWSNDLMPVLYPGGIRNLAALAALVATAVVIGRRRAALSVTERTVARLWTAGVNLLVLVWSAVEASHLAHALHGTGGRWARPPSITGLPAAQEMRMLAPVVTSAAWVAQAIVLLALGWRQDEAFLRWLGLGLFGFTVVKFVFFDLQNVDVFWRFLIAIVVGAALLAVSYLYQRRVRLGGGSTPRPDR